MLCALIVSLMDGKRHKPTEFMAFVDRPPQRQTPTQQIALARVLTEVAARNRKET